MRPDIPQNIFPGPGTFSAPALLFSRKGVEELSRTYPNHSEIRRVVEQWSPMLLRLAYSYLGSTQDAEDVVQEVFLAFMDRGRPFADEGHERAWLVRVTINKCKNELKSAWRAKRGPMPDQVPAPAPPLSSPVLDAMATLPEHFRIPLHLHYCEGWSTQELAQILRIPAATVRTRLFHGRELLRAALEGGVH